MSSPHLPGPHGFIIASKMSLFLLLFCWAAQFFPSQERNTSISIQTPVQLLNNSLPLFNNLFVNQTNSYQLIPYFEPNSFQLIPKPNSFQLIPKPNSFQPIPKPNSYQLICRPNSFQLVSKPNSFQPIPKPNSFQMLKPNSYQLIPKPNSYQLIPYFEPDSYQVVQNNNSTQELHETTPLKNNTSEQAVLYLLLRLQDIFVDSENKTRENETIHYNLERNIIMNQINSFFINSI